MEKVDFNEILPRVYNKTMFHYFRKIDNTFKKITEYFSVIAIVFELVLSLKLVQNQTDTVTIYIAVSSIAILSLVIIGILLPIAKQILEFYIIDHPEKFYDKNTVYEVKCYDKNEKLSEILLVQETSNYHYYREYASKTLIPRAMILEDTNGTYCINECALSGLHTITGYKAVRVKNKIGIQATEEKRIVDDNEKKEYCSQILSDFYSRKRFRRYLKTTYRI